MTISVNVADNAIGRRDADAVAGR